MDKTVLITAVVSALLLPPLNLMVLCFAGWIVRRRWSRTGTLISVIALALLLVISTRAGARLLSAPLEQRVAPLLAPRDSGAQAIVVLSGGRQSNAPEYDGKDSPHMVALVRLRYAAKLQRETGLPILATGGTPDGAVEPEAAGMARVLREDFRVPVQWLEERSRTTAENATYSAAILKEAGVHRILLVTSAIHMPRAVAVFATTGLEIVPAPTSFVSRERHVLSDFVPDGEGLWRSHQAMHEWIGLLWYRWRHSAAMPDVAGE